MDDFPAPQVVWLAPEGCTVVDRGVSLSIHRAPVQGRLVREVREGLEAAASTAPRGLISVGVFRLSPEFPLSLGLDANRKELAALLRALDRVFVAHATIIEFGGVRAATMRLITRAVRTLARPRAAFADFDSLTEGVNWLRSHAERARAPTDHATYMRLYRAAERQLDELDMRRGAVASPARR